MSLSDKDWREDESERDDLPSLPSPPMVKVMTEKELENKRAEPAEHKSVEALGFLPLAQARELIMAQPLHRTEDVNPN